jgi:spore coat protein U-like protein
MPLRAARVVALLGVACCANGAAWAACTVTATGVAFGTYDPSSGTDRTANGSVSVACSLDAGLFQNYSFTASVSTGNAPSYASRYMVRAGGTERLNYNLYNASYSQVLGNGSAGTMTFQGSIFVWFLDPSNTLPFTIAGRIPAAQNARPGAYSDTIIVTLNY